MSKKQKNLALGIAILAVSLITLLFSEDSSKLISFGENQKSETKEVSNNEVIVAPKVTSEVVRGEIDVSISPKIDQEKTINLTLYQVVKVVDGDTVDVNINGKVERLRLIGIDTPETVDPRKSVQCFGKQASDKAKEILSGKSVGLEADESQGDRDKYGRLLRYVFLPDGKNFNLYMISEGYAHEYTYDSVYKYQKEFKQAEIEARNAGRGLWSPETCSGNV